MAAPDDSSLVDAAEGGVDWEGSALLDLATGIANFAKYADRGEVLSTVSAGERSDDAAGDAVAPQVATFRLD